MKRKMQSKKCKVKVQSLKLLILSFGFMLLAFSFTLACYAQEITILYTGETHAMLYPCSCPVGPDGGVARRASLIKQIKEDNPNTLVLDSGGFFSGGLQDEYAQNIGLDKQRAIVNIKAMELMNYDAAAIGDDEFNFGKDFFEDNTANSQISFLSCNILDPQRPGFFKPYIIKEFEGVKVGIIGVSNPLITQKESGLKFIDPRLAVEEAVSKLKKDNVNIIVLLSHLGESEDLNLINGVAGIDILIIGHNRAKEENFSKINHTLIVRPFWQGRSLGEINITLKDNKIANYKIEAMRLSDKIASNPEMLSILPRCFSDSNCKQEGSTGFCQDAGTLKSKCTFTRAARVELLIVTTKLCNACNTEPAVKYLKNILPGLAVSYLYYPDGKSNKLINKFGIDVLPVYFFGKEVAKESGFEKLKENLQIKGNYYMISPQFVGFAYYLHRKNIKGKLDLFLSLYDKNAPALLDMIKEFKPDLHFLAIENAAGDFDTQAGNLETEEDLRSVCVQKYYPDKFWDYISCRAKFINSSWWQDCLDKQDADKITICARSEEAKALLRNNIGLNSELQVKSGPSYLVDNQEIFGSQGIPDKEKFKTIIKR